MALREGSSFTLHICISLCSITAQHEFSLLHSVPRSSRSPFSHHTLHESTGPHHVLHSPRSLPIFTTIQSVSLSIGLVQFGRSHPVGLGTRVIVSGLHSLETSPSSSSLVELVQEGATTQLRERNPFWIIETLPLNEVLADAPCGSRPLYPA
jgi:hypothetical protein